MHGTRSKLIAKIFAYSISVISIIFLVEVAFFTFGQNNLVAEKQSVNRLDFEELPTIRSIGSENDFREIIERPLFNWNREPRPVQTTDQGGTSEDIEMRWELSAIVAEGAMSHAYFRELKGGRSVHLEEGMYLESWRVESIQAEQVLLSDSGDEKVFRFKAILKADKPKARRARSAKRISPDIRLPANATKVKQINKEPQ